MFKKRNALFDCNFVYFLILSFFVVIRIISATFDIGEVMGYILNAIIQIGLAFSLPVFLFSYLRKQPVRKTLNDYGFKKITAKTFFCSLALGVLVYIITIFIASFFSVVLKGLGYESSSSGVSMTSYPVWLLFLELFTTAILPGICEEVAHRGMLLNNYKCLGAKKAILLSGLLFGLMHLNINQFFYATILGFYFGYVALSCGSIYPTMIMHFTNNAISTFMTFAIVNNMPIGSFLDNVLAKIISNGFALAILVLFMFIVLIVSFTIWLTRYIIKDSRITQMAQMADTVIKQQLRNELLSGIEEAKPIENSDVDVQLNPQVVDGKRLVSVNFKTNINQYKQTYNPSKKDMIFLYASLFLGIVLTISTFIWGIL